MSLISLSDITNITGLTDSALDSLIPYAEAQAKAMLGFLEEETKTQEFFIYEKTDTLRLDFYPITSVESITYKASADSTEETIDTDEYRVIKDEGLIIFDSKLKENYTVKVTYKIGWTSETVTNIVKLFLVVLTVNQYYSLRPDKAISSQTIVSEKIGDYAVKYANVKESKFKSLDEWVDYLCMLVKKGGNVYEVY